MSKKKTPGSSTTMTLKDFHGGSIPSDLPLPSAPGVIERIQNRPTSWGLRPDHRQRPGSAGAVRSFDDKTPFLTSSLPIGQNFDEDERKPLGAGAGSGSRRMISDKTETAYPLPTSREAEVANVEGISIKLGVSGLSAPRCSEGASYGKVASGVCGNAWAKKPKEVVLSATEALPASLSGTNVASKLAHASAFDKVSSGAWQSKQHSRSCVVDVAGDAEYQETSLTRHTENSFMANDGVLGGGRGFSTSERISSPVLSEAVGIKHLGYAGDAQPALDDVNSNISELHLQETAQKAERPKLKLLPRSKPLENSVPHVHVNQGNQTPHSSPHQEDVTKSGVTNTIDSDLVGSQSGSQEFECPKLNFRWQPHLLFQSAQHVEGGGERRNAVHGGALPRESVLKERNSCDVSVNNHNVQPHSRAKQDPPRTKAESSGSTRPGPVHYTGKTHDDQRMRSNVDRWTELEKTDSQRGNWRNEKWRNHRETEKKQRHQPPPERPHSPETWRKPVPTSSSVGVSGTGKAVSAVDLAQSFSRSVSDPETAGPFTGQSQVPFSRLTNPTSRRQINGY